jgi:hypothetical protein
VLEYSSTAAVSGFPFQAEAAVLGSRAVLAWRRGMKKSDMRTKGTVLYRAEHEVRRSIVQWVSRFKWHTELPCE